MRQPLKIGDKEYKYKKDAILYYRAILNSYNYGQSLNDSDFNDLMDLLSFEYDYMNDLDSDSVNEDEEEKEDFAFDRNHFSDKQVENIIDENKRYFKCPTSKTNIVEYENVEQLSQNIKIFKNERYYCLTDGDFIFGDFIEAFIRIRGMKVTELTISTLSLSQDNIDSLFFLMEDDFVENLNLIVSDHFFSYERNNLIEYMYNTLDFENRFQLSVCNNKSKIILIKTEDDGGRKYTIHGSANLSSSNSIEQFSIEENEELYDYNKSLLDKLADEFETIDKKSNYVKSNEIKASPILDNRKSFDEFSERKRKIIDIKIAKVQFSKKCFELFYDDNTSEYMSYLMIINNTKYTPEKLFYVACRNSTHQDIRSVKLEYFDKNSVKGKVKCQETGILSEWSELVVDHRQPNTFSVIVDRFKEVNRVDLNSIKYIFDEQNHIVFQDKDMIEQFRNYHKEKASLRIVRTECNSSRTGLARIKRSSKDLTVK